MDKLVIEMKEETVLKIIYSYILLASFFYIALGIISNFIFTIFGIILMIIAMKIGQKEKLVRFDRLNKRWLYDEKERRTKYKT